MSGEFCRVDGNEITASFTQIISPFVCETLYPISPLLLTTDMVNSYSSSIDNWTKKMLNSQLQYVTFWVTPTKFM